MKIGAQLFTVREFCKTTEDFAETLKRVADIGYTTVQVSGTCAYEPVWLKEQLQKNGLECVLTHIPAAKLQGDCKQIAKEHDVFGCDLVGLGMFKFNEEEENQHLEDFFRLYEPVGKALKEHGKYFMYHNHEGEFQKYQGKLIIDHLAERIPADEMGFTLDTFWVQVAGGDPAQWIEKLSGRVPCIHLKDCAFGRTMAALGDGNINFDRVFEKAQLAGTKYMVVEQDNCNGEDPFECLKRSYDYLRARGFE